MEKKTLGSFLTALRKANGMTQKELADRLNVSDKAVSRWERDENYPDLVLIPVIADIFGVTSDELLRGERKTGDAPVSTEKSDRQIRHLVDNVTFRYIVGSLIAVVAAIGGLILQICVAINVGREPSERVVLAITTALMFGLWIAACMFVGLTYWSSCRKLSAAEDSEAAATGKKRIRKYFLGETVFLVALFVLLIGAVSDESGDFESSLLMFLVLLAVGALLVSPLPKRLWKHFTGYRLTTEKARRSFRRKAVVLSVLFVVLYVFVLYAGNVTGGAFFGPGKWFFNEESFCDYMSEVNRVDEGWAQLGCVRFFGEPKIYERWTTLQSENLSENEWISFDGFGTWSGD
ncbi:MAG: helix-turn-helix transcriptional regulator, partial [Lachnospiraceae bacterium]|nr:helix-turn-helix transcriptional regulator [Lachnospiraceae bacterium]